MEGTTGRDPARLPRMGGQRRQFIHGSAGQLMDVRRSEFRLDQQSDRFPMVLRIP